MILVQRLREIQNRFGYLPDESVKQLSKDTNIPLPRIQEVASSFPHFRQWQDAPHVEVKVCRDMSCHLRGAQPMLTELRRLRREDPNEGRVVIEGTSCLGRCDRPVAVMVSRYPKFDKDHPHEPHHPSASEAQEIQQLHRNPFAEGDKDGHFHDWVYTGRTPEQMAQLISSIVANQPAPTPNWDYNYSYPERNEAVAWRKWQINPYGVNSESWVYAGVRKLVKPDDDATPKVVAEWTPESAKKHALKQLQDSGLVGMGGAGMPAYIKWNTVAEQKRKDGSQEKYIVCNGDESEPATFKDRELLLHLPHLVIEGVIMAGLITGATAGYIFIRHEYTEQIRAVRAEIERAKDHGYCGDNIFESGRSFPVEVFESPGGYICGEQSALIEAMEDKPGRPRNKPPELMTNGLWDRPTVVNNVETFAWTPSIMIHGGTNYKSQGTNKCNGRRILSICGDLVRPGVYEVPIGTTMKDLIGSYCEGIPNRREVGVLATSGPSGGLLPAKLKLGDRERKALQDRYATLQQSIERAEQGIEEETKKKAEFAAKLIELTKQKSDAADNKPFSANLDADIEKTTKGESGCTEKIKSFTSDKSGGIRQREFLEKYLPRDTEFWDMLETPLEKNTFNQIAEALRLPSQIMVGAGMSVYSDEASALDQLLRYTEFFRNESCGKCVPCRLGSQKLVEIGTELLAKRRRGPLNDKELNHYQQLITDISFAMTKTSICGLGQVASNPLISAVAYFV